MSWNYGYPDSEPENTGAQEGEFGENTYSAIYGRPKIECMPLDGPEPDLSVSHELRHLKMELKSLIVAKQVCTGQQAEEAYLSMFGYCPRYADYGYRDIDDLLTSSPEICKGYTNQYGVKVYNPVVDERHKDLAFQLSRAPRSPSKREHRPPVSHGPNRTSLPPARSDIPPTSDVRYRQPWLKDRVPSTKSIGQFPQPCAPVSKRIKFKDDGAKCPERCQVIADMVRQIGQKSPDGTETRCHIEALKNHYYHWTALSLWGKIMPIREYAESMGKPDYYEFWRIMTEQSTAEEGGLAYYMVVPTDPSNNYFHRLNIPTASAGRNETTPTRVDPPVTPVRGSPTSTDYFAQNLHRFAVRVPPIDSGASEYGSNHGSSNASFEIYYNGEKNVYMVPPLF